MYKSWIREHQMLSDMELCNTAAVLEKYADPSTSSSLKQYSHYADNPAILVILLLFGLI